MRSYTIAAAALSLASSAYAQLASTCPETDVCYALNIPDATASSGSGDIFFQISAPTSYEWVALGQGSSMSGANIFVVYTSADGSNVTVSPRLGSGHVQPEHDTAAQITVLDGSGVSNGKMTANVRCSNCNSWSGGSMDFSSSSASWIYATKSGSSLNSDDLGASISQHESAAQFDWKIAQAVGGSSVNPFQSSASSGGAATTGAAATTCTPAPSSTLAPVSGASGCPTAWPSEYSTSWPTARPTWAASCFASGRPTDAPWPTNAPWQQNNNKRDVCEDGSGSSSSSSSASTTGGNSSADFSNNGSSFGGARMNKVLTAHAVLACIAFVALFPIGGILIRVASFTGLIWVHAAMQMIAYLIYIVAFGMGVWMASNMRMMTQAHPIIGIVLFIILLAQPIFGILHHKLFEKYGHRTMWSYAHLSIGRIAIILGMVNGGLGLQLAGAENSSKIAYAVIAAIVGIVYIAAVVFGELRRRRGSTAPPTYERSQKDTQLHDLSGSSSDENVPRNEEFYGKRNRNSQYEGA